MAELKSALHASAPEGHKGADCSIDEEPCLTCYAAWWKQGHPHHNEVDFQALFCEFSTLLDAIEAAIDEGEIERAEELVAGRFNIARKHGLIVEITGMVTSGRTQ